MPCVKAENIRAGLEPSNKPPPNVGALGSSPISAPVYATPGVCANSDYADSRNELAPRLNVL